MGRIPEEKKNEKKERSSEWKRGGSRIMFYKLYYVNHFEVYFAIFQAFESFFFSN